MTAPPEGVRRIRLAFHSRFQHFRLVNYPARTAACLASVLTLVFSCFPTEFDGPGVITAYEFRSRTYLALSLKAGLCNIPYPNEFLLLASPYAGKGSRDGVYYGRAEADRCIEAFDRIPCELIPPARGPADFAPFYSLIVLLCPGISSNSWFDHPYMQGSLF